MGETATLRIGTGTGSATGSANAIEIGTESVTVIGTGTESGTETETVRGTETEAETETATATVILVSLEDGAFFRRSFYLRSIARKGEFLEADHFYSGRGRRSDHWEPDVSIPIVWLLSGSGD